MDLPDGGPAIFAVVLSPVMAFKTPAIEKDPRGILKGHAVLLEIQRRLRGNPIQISP